MIVTDLLTKLATSKGCNHSLDYYSNILSKFEIEEDVTKNIFQICFQNIKQDPSEIFPSLPRGFQDAINHLRQLNSGWDYHLFNEVNAREFIVSEYGETVYAYYERINPVYGAARADFLRYLLLYRYGGVYVDFVLHAVKNMSTVGGGYQKQLRFTDYRKQARPLVSCGNRLLDVCNWGYLRVLSRVRSNKSER